MTDDGKELLTKVCCFVCGIVATKSHIRQIHHLKMTVAC